MAQKIIFSNYVDAELDKMVAEMKPASVFVVTDTNAGYFVLPVLQSQSKAVNDATVITIPSGDATKTLDTVTVVYNKLVAAGATRNSLIINVGGGVVTDLGGFVAATFKRGMHFVNVPTTLLGAVDAAVGGKTGVNFGTLKNQIGAFAPADAVFISTTYFNTLSQQEMLSGYAEMIKHALLSSDAAFAEVMNYPVLAPMDGSDRLLKLLEDSVRFKESVVVQDPKEQGLRKSLNLGHTIGHAFESLALKRKSPIPHGYAVAWGLVVESILSHMLEGFDSKYLHTLSHYVKENYGVYGITCDDYPALLEYMRGDKKNDRPDAINFTLLGAPGDVRINRIVPEDQITAALDIYRDLSE